MPLLRKIVMVVEEGQGSLSLLQCLKRIPERPDHNLDLRGIVVRRCDPWFDPFGTMLWASTGESRAVRRGCGV